MAYRPIQIPPLVHISVIEFVRDRVDPLLADVHSMLRLPIQEDTGLHGGCTFSSTLVLLATVDGIAQHLYQHPKKETGPRFRALLEAHYPWSEEPKTADAVIGSAAADTLYSTYRDQLAHRLGLVRGNVIGDVKILKGPLREDRLEQIEQSKSRLPEWSDVPTLRKTIDDEREVYRLLLKRFYWGVRIMTESVLEQKVLASHSQNPMLVPTNDSGIVHSTPQQFKAFTKISSGST
jgi:hypothetical protein